VRNRDVSKGLYLGPIADFNYNLEELRLKVVLKKATLG
jgi:hypothetical protein